MRISSTNDKYVLRKTFNALRNYLQNDRYFSTYSALRLYQS